MIKLDLKNKKILYELDTNSRQSYHKIAKKVGLSKDSIIYRMNKLEKQDLIKKYHTVIDVGKLGFISFKLYLKFQNTNEEKEQEIIDFLKSQNQITWLISIEGNYDLGMWIITKSIKEMNQLWKNLLNKYVNFISNRNLTIFTKVSYYPRSYLLDLKNNDKEFIFITEPTNPKIDQVDLKILRLMAPNARINILNIAKKLNLTTKTISARIKSLEKRKIIVGYRTMFDIEKLGKEYFKLMISVKNINSQKRKQFIGYIKQHPNTIYNNEILGGYDFEIEVELDSLRELREFIKEIKNNFSSIIKEITYLSFYKEHKYLYFPV